ncbi:MAG: hypothetical protein NVS2B7_38440 [Herpetosiphon sp.]
MGCSIDLVAGVSGLVLALLLIAVSFLNATPVQIGVLVAVNTIAGVLLGFIASLAQSVSVVE